MTRQEYRARGGRDGPAQQRPCGRHTGDQSPSAVWDSVAPPPIPSGVQARSHETHGETSAVEARRTRVCASWKSSVPARGSDPGESDHVPSIDPVCRLPPDEFPQFRISFRCGVTVNPLPPYAHIREGSRTGVVSIRPENEKVCWHNCTHPSVCSHTAS